MKNGVIKLTFVGDLMCQAPQLKFLREKGLSYDTVFDFVRDLFDDSDYVMANLETPVSDSHSLSRELMSFNAPVSFLTAIKGAGIDFVSLANNHIWDCGPKGVDETIANARKTGLDFAGAYDERSATEEILIKEMGGVKIAIIACTYETNFGRPQERMMPDTEWKVDLLKRPERYPLSFWFPIRRWLSNLVSRKVKDRLLTLCAAFRNPRRIMYCCDSVSASRIGAAEDESYRMAIERKIRRAKAVSDLVIVLPHIGGQHNPAPGLYHEYTMQWMSKAGADIIVAGHAHVPQRACRMDTGTVAAYCLGDFVFSMVEDRYNTGFLTNTSIVLNVFVDRKTKSVARVTFSPCEVPVGCAAPRPIAALHQTACSPYRREQLFIENEAVVRMVRGGTRVVPMREEYELPLEVPAY